MKDPLLHSGSLGRERRYMCIYFPEWSIDVTRRALGAKNPRIDPPAVLLTSNIMNQQVVVRACRVARSHGVKEMMSRSLAKALTPDSTHIEPFTPVRDAQALYTLAVWSLTFSPIAGLDGELSKRLRSSDRHKELMGLSYRHYGIALDLTGTEKIHRDFSSLGKTLHGLFQGAARVSIAPSLGAAWALSRYGISSLSVVSSLTQLTTYLSSLPLEALRIESTTCQKLADVGIYTIGDLDQVPRQSLGQRFGKQLLCRLGQLYGTVAEHITPVSPLPIYHEYGVFEPPLTHRRAITAAIEHLFAKLLATLKKKHLAAKLFLLSITDSENNTREKELSLAAATGDTSHLKAIITPVIESLVFCGEITSVLLEARDTSRVAVSQRNLHGNNSQDPDTITGSYNELLNSLSLRLGRDRVQRATLTSSYIPERSFLYSSEIDNSRASHHTEVRELIPAYNAPYMGPTDRPPILLSPPEPIISIAMLPDKPPAWIRWRGAKLTITYGIGPERITPEWWHNTLQEKDLLGRDYFTVQDQLGRWLWVFRCLSSQSWFVHGVWR